jgi:two-component system OmpR family response regulator
MAEVLVIDDTKNIRMLLTKCLEFEGYTVSTASDGTAALDMISKKRFDLIFLDVRMPEISGTEVLRRIREMGVNTPVVIITAFGTVKNAVECTRLGAVAYLQKPFTENKIKQVLEEVLHFKPERSNLENILSLAEEQINNSRFGDAERLLRNSLSTFPMEPEIYLLMSKVYNGLNQSAEADKFLAISTLLQK